MFGDDSRRSGAAGNGPPGAGYERRAEPNGGMATLDEVLNALAHPRRRTMLYYLQDAGMATVDELARQIAARELDIRPDEVPADVCEPVTVELVHTHLPQLADALFIEYDQRSQTATYTDPLRLLDDVLDILAELEGELGG